LHQHLDGDGAWALDSLLTRTFLLYARDLSQGRIAPQAVDTEWTAARRTLDLATLLDAATEQDNPVTLLQTVAPPHAGYHALQIALRRYRELAHAGDWPRELGQRLAVEGYDTTAGVDAAVREFQRLHGLTADGVVGPVTRAALDVSPAARAEQIALNLERWRWLPRNLGTRHVMVNSAAFTLDLVEHDSTVWQTRAIVGRLDWPTPIVSSVATGFMFRPVWKVPRIIAARELLQLIQRDSTYVRRERFHVFSDSLGGLRGIELDPALIDWRAVSESTFTYQLAQDPGGDNPLGGVKLVFWNPYSVFIHDTPARPLFEKRARAFSHGCVRVEHAATLVAQLLPAWPSDSIRRAMVSGRERWVRLPRAIPVHLAYWTAWVGDDGLVAFVTDSYGWDAELATALRDRDHLVISARAAR
jgi:L,D-transpeptidase YcbB